MKSYRLGLFFVGLMVVVLLAAGIYLYAGNCAVEGQSEKEKCPKMTRSPGPANISNRRIKLEKEKLSNPAENFSVFLQFFQLELALIVLARHLFRDFWERFPLFN